MSENLQMLNHPSVAGVRSERSVQYDGSLINPDFSRRITALRFVLAVFVVFIHSTAGDIVNGAVEVSFSGSVSQIQVPLYVQVVQNFCTSVFGGVAVPLFFVISSYLFFAKPKPVSKTVKSKLRSIVVPYIFWTVLTILLYFAAQSFSFSRAYFSKEENIIRSWHFADFVKAFVGRKFGNLDYWHPLVYQFWYVRNLLAFMIFSPVIKFLAGRFPLSYFCVILSLSILRMCGVFSDPLWIFPALFYFSLGFYAVRFIEPVLSALDRIRWNDFLISYFAFTVLRMYFDFAKLAPSPLVSFLHCIFTILAFVKLAGIWSRNEKVFARLSSLSDFSFWIYAAHAPFVVTAITKLIVKVLPMQRFYGTLILLQFFATAFLTVLFLMILGIALKKFLPRLFAFITGGR